MRTTEHAPRKPRRVLERRHGLAEIVERGAGVHERLRVIPPQIERDLRSNCVCFLDENVRKSEIKGVIPRSFVWRYTPQTTRQTSLRRIARRFPEASLFRHPRARDARGEQGNRHSSRSRMRTQSIHLLVYVRGERGFFGELLAAVRH